MQHTGSMTAAHSHIQPKEQLLRCTSTYVNVHTQTQIPNLHKANTLEKTLRRGHVKLQSDRLHPSHSHSTCSHPRDPTNTQTHTLSSPALEPPVEHTLLNCAVLSIPKRHPQRQGSLGQSTQPEHTGGPGFPSEHCTKQAKRRPHILAWGGFWMITENFRGLPRQGMHAR